MRNCKRLLILLSLLITAAFVFPTQSLYAAKLTYNLPSDIGIYVLENSRESMPLPGFGGSINIRMDHDSSGKITGNGSASVTESGYKVSCKFKVTGSTTKKLRKSTRLKFKITLNGTIIGNGISEGWTATAMFNGKVSGEMARGTVKITVRAAGQQMTQRIYTSIPMDSTCTLTFNELRAKNGNYLKFSNGVKIPFSVTRKKIKDTLKYSLKGGKKNSKGCQITTDIYRNDQKIKRVKGKVFGQEFNRGFKYP